MKALASLSSAAWSQLERSALAIVAAVGTVVVALAPNWSSQEQIIVGAIGAILTAVIAYIEASA